MPPGIPATEDVMTNILEEILKGNLVVWVMHRSSLKEGKSDILAIALTTIITDMISKIRSLLIYSLYGTFNRDGEKDWAVGLGTIRGYAKKQGCAYIRAYSNVEAVHRIVKKLGADISQHLIVLEI